MQGKIRTDKETTICNKCILFLTKHLHIQNHVISLSYNLSQKDSIKFSFEKK